MPHIAIIDRLINQGFSAYIAGGAVRDSLLGKEPKDHDVVTSALPCQIVEIFPDSILDGMDQGVIKVKLDSKIVDVATMRLDGNYSDGRRPDQVVFTDDLEADSRRRDFTINSMYQDRHGIIIDHNGGREDLNKKLIRCVGNPHVRFEEDKLRMLRAIRFAVTLGFELDPSVLSAIHNMYFYIMSISKERINAELARMLEHDPVKSIELLKQTRLLEPLLPHVARLETVPGDPVYHPEGNVLIHTLQVLENLKGTSLVSIVAGLFHDVGKYGCCEHYRDDQARDRVSHIGHELESADITASVLQDLKFSNDFIRKVIWLVRNHMRFHKGKEMRIGKTSKMLREAESLGVLESLIQLQHADSNRPEKSLKSFYEEFIIPKVWNDPPLVTGKDLINLGFKPGPLFSDILDDAREKQDEGLTRQEILDSIKVKV